VITDLVACLGFKVCRASDRDTELRNSPYFLVVSTIEPRKNHALLIEIWRRLIERGGSPPKLVLVGRRGWESEQTFRELDFAPDLQQHLVQVPCLPSAHLRLLIRGAVAVLMPSFAEGYGIPSWRHCRLVHR
jgi:glycosyltransferase involved in cell wall biosynthesis